MSRDKILKVAKEAALEAGALLKRKYGKFRELAEKPDAGLVTEADRGAEALIKKRIKKNFPTHGFLGEETGETKSSGQEEAVRWIVDPLDGTTNFVHGFPLFCVSIGVEIKGKLEVGVIYHPLENKMYWAMKGHGAFCNKKRLKVSATPTLEEALLTTGFSYRKNDLLKKELRTFSKFIHKTRGIRRTGSAALDLCFVAAGQLDGFFERGLSPWDVAAGLVIVQEAGGRCSNFEGKQYQLGEESVLVSNGKIHPVLIRLILE